MVEQFFKKAKKAGVGLAGLGVITGVGAGIASKVPAVGGLTPAALTGGFATISGFAPIAVTAGMGKATLDIVKKLNKPKGKKRYGVY